ncbi:MAG: hypothetical protein K6G10_04820 [Butyrivibrio sp.]|nr:hypothetical protein [Butyrivibrio sp.]
MSGIRITLHSDMCLSTGQNQGTRVQTDICTDRYGIPFIPARRIKGCLREAAKELLELGLSGYTKDDIQGLFGDEKGRSGALYINDGLLPDIEEVYSTIEELAKKGTDIEKKAVHPGNISGMYTYRRFQMSMKGDDKGPGTLRTLNVLVHYDPLDKNKSRELEFIAYATLAGKKEYEELLKLCCKAVRHMGFGRNRGLGNVSLIYEAGTVDNNKEISFENLDADRLYSLEYRLTNVSPLVINGFDGAKSHIPAKNLIGALAGKYLKNHEKSAEFDSLFLDGTAIWSDLTPCVNGERSFPVPLMIASLKNDGGRLINRFAGGEDSGWRALKPKTVETGYMTIGNDGAILSDIPIKATAHRALNAGGEAFFMDHIDKGYVFSGRVIAPGRLVNTVARILCLGDLRFGKSRSAQYSCCRVTDIFSPKPYETEAFSVKNGEPVFVILKSDMLINSEDGPVAVLDKDIRKALAKELGLADSIPEDVMDLVSFKTIGGYQAMWRMQKPLVHAVAAGSVFCFKAAKDRYPKEIFVGRNRQEGFGLCGLFSGSEINGIRDIRSCEADRPSDAPINPGQYCKLFKNAVLARVYDEVISSNAKKVAEMFLLLRGKKIPKDIPEVGNKKRNGIPVHRLRLMAFEATDYADLRKSIDRIKKNDVDSSNAGRRYECHELLDEIYGKNRKSLSVSAMLGLKESEMENMQMDPEVQRLIEADWKRPLDIVMQSLHYSRRR